MLSGSSSLRIPSPPSSAQELLCLQTAPTPTPNPGQADNGPENQAGPRPLPAAPRGRKIEKHKAIFKVLFVYPRRLCEPEKWYHLWEEALISFLTCSKPHFSSLRKAKKTTVSKGDLSPGLPSCPAGRTQVYVGAQPPVAVPWSAAGTGPQIQAQGSGVKDLEIQESR